MEIRKKYVAYGSNMNLEQMKRRCPTAKVIGKGVLKDYELLFRGSPYGAFATVEPKEGATVPVLIWEIGKDDERSLDRYEGYPRHYGKERIPVETEHGTEEIMAYIMNEGPRIGVPSRSYLGTITAGYLEAEMDIKSLLDSVDHCQELLEKQLDNAEGESLWAAQQQC